MCSKDKKKDVPKVASTHTSKPAERLCLDISTFKNLTLGGSKHWLLIIDEYMSMKWPFFLKNKSDLCCNVISFLDLLENSGYVVKHL